MTISNDSVVNNSDILSPQPFLPWDNPDNIISRETYFSVVAAASFSITPLLFLVGAPTNLLSAVVFWRQGLKDRNNLCLFVLALVDLVYVISLMTFCLPSYIGLVDKNLSNWYRTYCMVYFGGVLWGVKLSSGCISAIIAVDRCLCVVFPLKLESLMSTRTMGLLLGAVVIVMQLFYLVHVLSRDIAEATTPDGVTVYSIESSAFHLKHEVFVEIIDVILLAFIIPIATYVVVSVATAITVIKFRQAMSWRKATSSTTSSSSTQQTSLTTMLVLLSCVYIASTSPLLVFTLMRLALPDYAAWGRYSNFYHVTHALGTICTMVNSSVNFFVYYTRSSRFRQVLASLWGKGDRKTKSGDAEAVKSETQVSSLSR